MVSPGKRGQRGRREVRGDPVVADDSSPSRPSKRRKKTEDTPNAETAEEGDSSLHADQSTINMEDDEVVTRVTQYFVAPEPPVQASRDHSNSIHESNKDGVKAYAKIAAQDWTYYVTKLVVNIGRSSEPAQRRAEQEAPDSDDASAVHIDLGPSKVVSREHASIQFNSNEDKWWLSVKGRNALKVNGIAWKPTETGPLNSGDVIEIGGVEMMFVLPTELSDLSIARQYLERAGIVRPLSPAKSQLGRHPLPSGGDGFASQSSPNSKAARSQGSQRSLAPAPPDYKRPGTPPSVRARIIATAQKTPHLDTPSGPMLMNNDVDLSAEENKQIKPQYSYAQMITQAIMSTKEEKLNLAGIYNFIMSRYAYYRNQAPGGWQNSIRHNLSLNKAFEKVARSTDEPGKGMKWQLVPDSRDEMIHNAYRGGRGGHRGSSNPSSPSQLNYITSGPKDMAARDPTSVRKRKVSPSGSPQPRSALRDSHLTPVRTSRKPLPDEAGAGLDGSPLPRLKKSTTASSTLGLVENVPGSPTLTSSYLQEDGASFVTPAPHRVHPRLAPPSTAQRPSQHMPTSSPAPFWKYADYGSTPLKPAQLDLSPSKMLGGLPPPSSSPPPPARSKSPAASPTRVSRATADDPPSPVEPDEDGGFDLTKGFQSIGSFHAPIGQGKQVQPGHSSANGDPSTGSGS